MEKLFKHLGDRYEVLSGGETVRIIDETLKECGTPLTEEQRRNLLDVFGNGGICGNLDMPFIAYSWKDNYDRTGKFNAWRLTLPFYVAWIGLNLIFYLPAKWIFTGYFGFRQKDEGGMFLVKWRNKIWPNRHW